MSTQHGPTERGFGPIAPRSLKRDLIPSRLYELNSLPRKPDQAYTPYSPPAPHTFDASATPNAPPNTPTNLISDPSKPYINPFTPYIRVRPSTEPSAHPSTEPTTQPPPPPPARTLEQILGQANLNRWDAEDRAENPVGRKEKAQYLWKKFQALYLLVFVSVLVVGTIVGVVIWVFVRAARREIAVK